MQKKKAKKWCHPRHAFFTVIGQTLGRLIYAPKCRCKCRPFREQGKRQYLVLMNHQTAYDQFFISACFKGPLYYVGSEDVFSGGLLSALLKYAVAPIPIKKSVTDVRAVIDCMRVAKEGGSIAMAPEGNRTYSGRTGNMKPTVASLARKLALPIAIFLFEGGYGVLPRFADTPRGGRMTCGVVRVIEPEEYLPLSDAELFALLQKELFVDEARDTGAYPSKNTAEYLERCAYYCPKCGFSTFRSEKKKVTCEKCGLTVEYGDRKNLICADPAFPYAFYGDWYDAQEAFVARLTREETERGDLLYTDEACFAKVVPYKKKRILDKRATLRLFGDRAVVQTKDGEEVFLFANLVAAAVCGRNKLNLYRADGIYQFKGDKRFNALKYVNLYYHYRNITSQNTEENRDAEFLGL